MTSTGNSTTETGRTVSGEHVFRERQDGSLEFIGDFDGLYESDPDPWGQLGADERLASYYEASRGNLVRLLAERPAITSILEVGCGFGQVCRRIRDALPHLTVTGSDISAQAVVRACAIHPDIPFLKGDVTSPDFPEQVGLYDAVILNQLLWYMLEGLPTVLDNMHRLIKPGGVLIVCNAFMRTPQRYGSDVIKGFDGLVRYLGAETTGKFSFVEAKLHSNPDLYYDDGYVLMSVCSQD